MAIQRDRKEPEDTGWPHEVPSKEGGDYEKAWINKPPYEWASEGDKFKPKYSTSCFCGNLKFEFHGEPFASKCCHCTVCQRLHGAPFQTVVLWPKTSVRMVQNKNDSLAFFSNEADATHHHVPCKVSCKHCHSPLFDEGRNMVLAFPSGFAFKPGYLPETFRTQQHIFYGQRALDIPDGTPKWEAFEGKSKRLGELTDENYTAHPAKKQRKSDCYSSPEPPL